MSNASPGNPLNEYQARRLRVTFQYIDRLLGDIESFLSASASNSAFPRYFVDVSPEQRGIIEAHVAKIRDQLVREMEMRGIPKEPLAIPASHAISIAVDAIDIELEELMPENMRGYGDVTEGAARELNEVVEQLRALTMELYGYVRHAKSNPAKPV